MEQYLVLLLLLQEGVSTAFAGLLVAKKYGKINSYKKLLMDYFHLKQHILFYLIPIIFLFIIFGSRLIRGQLKEGIYWLLIQRFFIIAILFGGIEEIGWKYIFQPLLEKKLSFIASSVITSILWYIWHIMYFVLDGTLFSLKIDNFIGFLFGIIGLSFILGCVYNITKSLWLCVFYHAMFNAFSQAFISLSTFGMLLVIIMSIMISIILVKYKNKILIYVCKNSK